MKQAIVRLVLTALPCSLFCSLLSPPNFVCALPTLEDLVSRGERLEVPVYKSQLVLAESPVIRVSVVAPEIADVQILDPRQILVNGKSVGQTNLIIWTEDGKTRTIDVAVNWNTVRIREAMRKVLPDEAIEIIPLEDAVVLRGYVSEISMANQAQEITQSFVPKVINLLTVPGSHQVLLRVKIAEVSRTFRRAKGVDLFVEDSTLFGSSALGRFETDMSLGESTLSFLLSEKDYGGFLQLLQESGLMRILAEPNLITRSGETASFLVGGEFPIPVAQGGAVAGAITIEYKEYGVRLDFTPTVLTQKTIQVQIAPEVSELDFTRGVPMAGQIVPGIITRQARTVVKLNDGQTFAIAGLISQTRRKNIRSAPPFSGIPVVGGLFRRDDSRAEETELLIMVTPYLIAPLESGEAYEMPTEYSNSLGEEISSRELSAVTPPPANSATVTDAPKTPLFEYQDRLREEMAYRARGLAKGKPAGKNSSDNAITEDKVLSGKGIATIQQR